MRSTLSGVCLLIASCFATAHAGNAITVGALQVEPPTLISLGFDWLIDGDDNRNARVAVQYRKQGDSQWQQGMDLLRLHRCRLPANLLSYYLLRWLHHRLHLLPHYSCRWRQCRW